MQKPKNMNKNYSYSQSDVLFGGVNTYKFFLRILCFLEKLLFIKKYVVIYIYIK